ncbi:MAG TPA: LPS export ABC transporter periplasmic protein LptC [Allosphingosinicella sp.]|nr:LPS export ABC transporter periplasmic protein LptC [Allosphingosinicella sp.]
MSELAVRERVVKQSWAAPGGYHDRLIRFLKIALPLLIGLLTAYLALAPLQKTQEISFLLDKNKVEVAKERMRVSSARYQGLDDRGRPFTIAADSAVQATSSRPIVDINGMTARILLPDGPATLRANRGRYDIERETVNVIGPILFTAADGYRLLTRDVAANLNDRTLASGNRVDGRMPLGTFSADRLFAELPARRLLLTGNVEGRLELGSFSADRLLAEIPARRVVLSGRARLHITQGGLR